MRVYVPATMHTATMYAVLGQVFDEDGIVRSTTFHLDFSECRHIDGTGLTLLDVLVADLRQQQCHVSFDIGKLLPLPLQAQLDWLITPNEGAHCFKSSGIEDAVIDNRHWQIHRVPVTGGDTWLVRVFNNWMAQKLYTSSLLVEPQTQCLSGLLENVGQHAGVDEMTVLFSWDKSVDHITFIVGDAGRGIPSSVRRSWSTPCSDEVALVKAIENGRQPGLCIPRGEGGLEKLVHAFVDQQIGHIVIASAFGRLHCSMGPAGKVYKFEPAHAFVPGTLVEVHFATGKMHQSSMLNEPAARSAFVFKQV